MKSLKEIVVHVKIADEQRFEHEITVKKQKASVPARIYSLGGTNGCLIGLGKPETLVTIQAQNPNKLLSESDIHCVTCPVRCLVTDLVTENS